MKTRRFDQWVRSPLAAATVLALTCTANGIGAEASVPAVSEAAIDTYHAPSSRNVGTAYGFAQAGPVEAWPGPIELVFVGSEPSLEQQRARREELQVMARILQRRVLSGASEGPGGLSVEYRMGIPLVVDLDEGQARTMYLEGFGAVFFLRVGYPLLGTPEESGGAAAQPAESPGSEWDRTRRELYGPRPPHGLIMGPGSAPGMPPAPSFDPARVTELRQQILEALASASNLELLADDESIVVVVKGPAAAAAPEPSGPGPMGVSGGYTGAGMAAGGMGMGMGASSPYTSPYMGMVFAADPAQGQTVLTFSVRKKELGNLPHAVTVNSYRAGDGTPWGPLF